MTSEDFKNIAEGVQAIIVASGVLAAGIWALLRFKLFGELSRAKLEVRQIEKALSERKGITYRLDVRSTEVSNGFLVVADVTVENVGPSMYHLDFSAPPFRICRVEEFSSSNLVLNEVARLKIVGISLDGALGVPLVVFDLLPSTVKVFSFCTTLTEAGAYLFSFNYPTPRTLASYDFDADEHIASMAQYKERGLDPVAMVSGIERFVCIGHGSSLDTGKREHAPNPAAQADGSAAA